MANVINDALKKLYQGEYIYYGSLIPKEVLEQVLNINMDLGNNEKGFWDSQGKFLALKDLIEINGYFTTQRGHNKSLYIIPVNQMSDYVNNILNKLKRTQKKAANIMQMADASLLNTQDKAKHYHKLEKLISLKRATKSILRKRG
jgi:hypothetical protein